MMTDTDIQATPAPPTFHDTSASNDASGSCDDETNDSSFGAIDAHTFLQELDAAETIAMVEEDQFESGEEESTKQQSSITAAPSTVSSSTTTTTTTTDDPLSSQIRRGSCYSSIPSAAMRVATKTATTATTGKKGVTITSSVQPSFAAPTASTIAAANATKKAMASLNLATANSTAMRPSRAMSMYHHKPSATVGVLKAAVPNVTGNAGTGATISSSIKSVTTDKPSILSTSATRVPVGAASTTTSSTTSTSTGKENILDAANTSTSGATITRTKKEITGRYFVVNNQGKTNNKTTVEKIDVEKKVVVKSGAATTTTTTVKAGAASTTKTAAGVPQAVIRRGSLTESNIRSMTGIKRRVAETMDTTSSSENSNEASPQQVVDTTNTTPSKKMKIAGDEINTSFGSNSSSSSSTSSSSNTSDRELRDTRLENITLRNEIEAMRAQIAVLTQQQQEQKEKEANAMTDTVTSNDASSSEITHLRSELSSRDTLILTLEDRESSLHTELTTLKSELSDLRTKYFEAIDAESELRPLRGINNDLLEENERLKKEITRISQEQSKSLQGVQGLSTEVFRLRTENTRLLQELTHAKKKVSVMKKQQQSSSGGAMNDSSSAAAAWTSGDRMVFDDSNAAAAAGVGLSPRRATIMPMMTR